MCLVALAVQPDREVVALLAGNRDERHARPTLAAHAWRDAPEVFGGRDLEKGGTWMGVTRQGRYAVLTNFRHPRSRTEGLSRGLVVRDFLTSREPAEAFLGALEPRLAAYPSFNLLVGDQEGAWYLSDGVEQGRPRRFRLEPGIHGLSNGRLQDPWPKVVRLRAALTEAVAAQGPPAAQLFRALADRRTAPDDELPHTGVELDVERFLSAPFLVDAEYGTRATTVLELRRDGLRFEERGFDRTGREVSRKIFVSTEPPGTWAAS